HQSFLLSSHGKSFNGFWEDDFAIYSLRAQETDLTSYSIKFIKSFKGSTLTISNPIVIEITKEHWFIRCGHGWHERTSINWAIEDSIWLASLNRRLPDILTIVILHFANGFHGIIIH